MYYTNDQLRSEGRPTRRFIYADDLGVAAQDNDFSVVEERLSNALSELTPYYEENYFCVNLSNTATETQVCAFHLRNHEANQYFANRKLKQAKGNLVRYST